MTKNFTKRTPLVNARYDAFEYEQNPETGYYQKKSGYVLLPDELRIEPVRVEEKYKYFGVSEILTSRQVNGITAFKTGLQKCSTTRNFYSGDIDQGNGQKTLVAIAFSLNKQFLRVFVFRKFWIDYKSYRLRSVEDFLVNQFKN